GIPGQKTTYLETKPIFAQYCPKCHVPPGPSGGLDLSTFPFTSRSFSEQADIVRDLLKWVVSTSYPMPPQDTEPRLPLVPAEKVAVIQKWLDDGLPKVPSGSDDLTDLASELVVHWQLQGGAEHGDLHIPRSGDQEHPFTATWANAIISGKYDLSVDVMAKD